MSAKPKAYDPEATKEAGYEFMTPDELIASLGPGKPTN